MASVSPPWGVDVADGLGVADVVGDPEGDAVALVVVADGSTEGDADALVVVADGSTEGEVCGLEQTSTSLPNSTSVSPGHVPTLDDGEEVANAGTPSNTNATPDASANNPISTRLLMTC